MGGASACCVGCLGVVLAPGRGGGGREEEGRGGGESRRQGSPFVCVCVCVLWSYLLRRCRSAIRQCLYQCAARVSSKAQQGSRCARLCGSAQLLKCNRCQPHPPVPFTLPFPLSSTPVSVVFCPYYYVIYRPPLSHSLCVSPPPPLSLFPLSPSPALWRSCLPPLSPILCLYVPPPFAAA